MLPLLFFSSEIISSRIFGKPELEPTLRAMSLGIVGLNFLTLCSMSLQGIQKIGISIFILNILVNVILIAVLFFLPILNADDLAIALSFATVITSIVAIIFWVFSVRNGSGTIKWRMLFSSCLPLWLVTGMTQLTQYSGQLIAGAWVDVSEVAQLAAAQRTAFLASFVLVAVNFVVAPRFAMLYKNNDILGLQTLAKKSVKVMLALSLPIVIIMLTAPVQIMSLFGEGFAGGGTLLQILVAGQFANLATGPVGFLLTMSGHEKGLRNSVMVSGPIAIGLALVLIPSYGVVGAASATSIALVIQNFFALYWVKRRLGFNTLYFW